MGSNMRFFLIEFVDTMDRSALQGFRYDASGSLHPVELNALRLKLTRGDLVFFDFGVDSLPKLSFLSEFNRLIKDLVLAMGPQVALDSVYFNDSRAGHTGLVSLRHVVQSIASKSLEPEPTSVLSISSLIYLDPLNSSIEHDLNCDAVNLEQNDVEVFYKQVVSTLVDEKVNKGQLKSFGLSQSLILAKLEELTERAYLESDLRSLELICQLTDRLALKELFQKASAALACLQLSKGAGRQFSANEGNEVAQLSFQQCGELNSQHTVRALAALGAFEFFNPEKALMAKESHLAVSHPLDFAFSFLEDNLLLLGYEQLFVDFFYESLKHLNKKGKLLVFQVGAFDGVHGDFLHDFIRDEECDVILIEPQSAPFEKLKVNYKNAKANIIYVNKAISVGDGLVLMYRVKSEFLNYYKRDDETYLGRIASFDKDYVVDNIRQKIARWGDGRLTSDDAVSFVEEFSVETTDFKDIVDFDILKNREVVLQIDCEGFDYKVMKGFPFEKKRPALIHFESDKLGSDKYECFRYLRALGYMVIEHGAKVPSDTLAIDLKNDTFIKALNS